LLKGKKPKGQITLSSITEVVDYSTLKEFECKIQFAGKISLFKVAFVKVVMGTP
jgi:hypothetical protein